MKIFSVNQAAKMLGMSRTSLLKEVNDGHIVAHRRRNKIIFFKKDIKLYERQNIINGTETTKNVKKNHLIMEQQMIQINNTIGFSERFSTKDKQTQHPWFFNWNDDRGWVLQTGSHSLKGSEDQIVSGWKILQGILSLLGVIRKCFVQKVKKSKT